MGKKIKEKPSYKEMLNNERTEDEEKALEDVAKNAYTRLKTEYLKRKMSNE